MAFFKVRIQRESKTTLVLNVTTQNPQNARLAASRSLSTERITDAKGIEITGQISGLRA